MGNVRSPFPGVTLERKSSRVLGDKYELDRMIGRGGMGSVWEATHRSLGTKVAIKFIERDAARSPEAHVRFLNEARASARIESRFVVRVFDHGISDDDQPYIVMELLRGETLERRLGRVGRLSLSQTAKLVAQIGRAIAKAHEVGIVHRDLKPENVFLCESADDGGEIAKVVDFGVAKFAEPPPGSESATKTGAMMGTPSYMSPEQARGLKNVDGRTDLWSLAIIAYECVVGKLPFEGEGVGDLLVKICGTDAPIPSREADDVPRTFDAWFGKATRSDPEKRFQTSLEMVRALLDAAGEPGLLASGTVLVERRKRADRRTPERPRRLTPRDGFARTTASFRDAKVSLSTFVLASVALLVGFVTVLRVGGTRIAATAAARETRASVPVLTRAGRAAPPGAAPEDGTTSSTPAPAADAHATPPDGGTGDTAPSKTTTVPGRRAGVQSPTPRSGHVTTDAPRRAAPILEELGY
ncbi:MAG: serine/threonine-protein kinase [Polyangiaceae bacterium]